MPQQVSQKPGEGEMTGLPENMEAQLSDAAPGGVNYSATTSPQGSVTAWCELANSEDLPHVGKMLLKLAARLAMASALQPQAPEEEEDSEEGEAPKADKETPKTFGGTPIDGKSYEIDYHFVLGGDFVTIIVFAPAGGSIPSLTPYFRAADWPEREIMENYALVMRGHPNPRRLFLDPAIDDAALERLIPYSTLVNAASTKALWEQVLAAKGAAS
jgi:NADH:ubiquinone oxidoreductase subunit C